MTMVTYKRNKLLGLTVSEGYRKGIMASGCRHDEKNRLLRAHILTQKGENKTEVDN